MERSSLEKVTSQPALRPYCIITRKEAEGSRGSLQKTCVERKTPQNFGEDASVLNVGRVSFADWETWSCLPRATYVFTHNFAADRKLQVCRNLLWETLFAVQV